MNFGAAIFFTDYSMGPAELGRALEERGFESLWAPEHSHIPLSRRSPFPQGGDLPKKYYDVMDPFVTLAAAAAATTRLRVGTGVCLVVQRDPIQTAKLVASLDQVSGGRFLFGIGAGWNAEEMLDHGTDFKKLVAESGRDPATLPITVFGVAEDADLIKRYGDAGVARLVFNLNPAKADEVLPALDRCAGLMRQAG